MSNSRIPSQKKKPLENSAITRGSQAIGRACLNLKSFLKPYCFRVQNFVLTAVSKWNPTIFFARTFTHIIIKKDSRVGKKIELSLKATVRDRIRVAIIMVAASDLSMFLLGKGFI